VAIYYVYSGAGGSNNGSSWANAFTTLTTAFVTEVAGDTLYVAHDHAETTAGTVTLTSSGTITNPTKVICVDRGGTVPPVSADRRATATVTCTTSVNLIIGGGSTHYDGIIFTAGSLTSTSSLQVPSTGIQNWYRFDNCSLRIGGSNAAGRIQFSQSGTGYSNLIELNNTTVSFANTSHAIQVGSILRWRNTPSALLGTIPTTLFLPVTAWGALVECDGVDFSAATSGKTLVTSISNSVIQSYKFVDCKMDASVTKSTVPAAHGSTEMDFVRCGATGVNYAVHRHRISGLLTEETTIVRTGGANDGTTTISWKIVTTANCTFSMPFECPPIAIWNDTTGSAVIATVEGIAAALPTDAEVWLDVEYLGSASSPQGSFVNDGKADLIAAAANQTSSSETWGGSTAAFKLAVTFTAQLKGWIYARVKIGKASSTIYIDPLVTLT